MDLQAARGWRAAVVAALGLLLVLTGVGGAGADDDVPDSAPTTTDDHVVMTPLMYQLEVDVLANDDDADGGDLQVCRLEAPDDRGLSVHIWSHQGEPGDVIIERASTYLLLEPDEALAPGSYPVSYDACDRQHLTPATLTVDVRRIKARPVADRPGTVRFTNPLDERIRVLYAAPHERRIAGGFRLEAHERRNVAIHRAAIVWLAFRVSDLRADSDDPWPVGFGRVRHTGWSGRAAHAAPRPGHGVRAGDLDARAFRAAVRRLAAPPNRHRDRGSASGLPAAVVTDGSTPVTVADHVTLDYYDTVRVDVLANDGDDEPGSLGVCRVDVPTGLGLSAMPEPWWAGSDRARSDDPDRYLEVSANSAEAGTYDLTYYACDHRSLTPGTLTVTVRAFPPPTARVVRPGAVRFHNAGYRTVVVTYFRSSEYSEKTRLRVPPHTSRTTHVTYDSLSYFANTRIGPLSDGRVRHVQQGALRPGR